MKKVKYVLPVILVIASVVLYSCLNFKEVEFKGIKSVNVVETTKDAITLDLMVHIKNPNNFKLKVTDVDLNVLLNDQELGKVTKSDKIVIPANSDDVQTLRVEVKLTNAKMGALSLLGSFLSGKTNITLKGTVKGKALGISRKIEVNEKMPINLKTFLH